jgi:putative ABC transport system permease protein
LANKGTDMLKNYFKITLRNLIKNKWFSLINIIGLTIGISASLIVHIYISQELSFDSFHKDGERLYRVTKSTETSNGIDYDDAIPYPLIKALKSDFTQFDASTQIHKDHKPLALVNGEKLIIDNVVFADSNFFDVFSYKILSGNARKALGAPNYALVSKRLAEQLFGNETVIGQKIKLRNLIEVEVAGVFEDIPPTSHLIFDMLVSYPTFSRDYLFGLPLDSWTMSAAGNAYVKLKEGLLPHQIDSSFDKMVLKYNTDSDIKTRKYYLQPIKDIRFDFRFNKAATDITTLWVLGIIGSFILIIACVNFVNLSTAMAVKKSKEVGVRKSLGASRFQLMVRYLYDTAVITVISGVLAIGLSERLIPLFNQYFDKQLEINLWSTSIFAFGIVFMVTLLSGLYPAIVLTKYNTIKALKSNIHSQNGFILISKKRVGRSSIFHFSSPHYSYYCYCQSDKLFFQ